MEELRFSWGSPHPQNNTRFNNFIHAQMFILTDAIVLIIMGYLALHDSGHYFQFSKILMITNDS